MKTPKIILTPQTTRKSKAAKTTAGELSAPLIGNVTAGSLSSQGSQSSQTEQSQTEQPQEDREITRVWNDLTSLGESYQPGTMRRIEIRDRTEDAGAIIAGVFPDIATSFAMVMATPGGITNRSRTNFWPCGDIHLFVRRESQEEDIAELLRQIDSGEIYDWRESLKGEKNNKQSIVLALVGFVKHDSENSNDSTEGGANQ